jgi:hypothetical protein
MIVEEVKDPTSFVADVRRITGMPIAAIRASVTGDGPLVEYLLFHNDHDEVADRLRQLLRLEDTGVRFRIFGMQPDETFITHSAKFREITPVVLKNILDAHDEGLRQLEDTDHW